MRLIGINGLKHAGKDTTYQVVRDCVHSPIDDPKLNPAARCERRAFADSLKLLAALALGYEGDDAELVGLMDRFKEDGFITTQFNALGGNGMDDTIIGSELHILTGRQYLQYFGANFRDVIGDGFWVDQVLPLDTDDFARLWSTFGRWKPDAEVVGLPAVGCVTDVRYPNEAERVLELGGEVWEVIRPGTASDGHSSEKPLPTDLVTTVVNNNGSISDLRRAVARLL